MISIDRYAKGAACVTLAAVVLGFAAGTVKAVNSNLYHQEA